MNYFVSRKSSSQQLLMQLITDKHLISEIQNLESLTVRKIIRHIGLEDASELLPLLSSEQLQEVMDQDTWLRVAPGQEDEFDAKRFSTWIEALLENGADFAADKVFEMDEELLTLALSNLVMALDKDEMTLLAIEAENDSSSEVRYLDKALESTFNMEFEGYLVMSKEVFHWDTVVNLLNALQKKHSDLVERVLTRISQMTLELVEEFDGLYNLLKESEMLDSDVNSDRQERREKDGYVSPSSAKAFLKLIDQSSAEAILQETEPDHIANMYFRGLRPGKIIQKAPLSKELQLLLESHGIRATTSSSSLRKLSSGIKTSQVQKDLQDLQITSPESFKKKLAELNFLANVLISGYSPDSGKKFLRPVEAMELAIQICDLGYIHSQDLLKAFKLGWKRYTKKEY